MKLHPLSAATRALQRGVVAAFTLMFLSSLLGGFLPNWIPGFAFVLLAPVAFVLAAGHQIAYYYRFEYELTPDTFDVQSGVFSRQEREIPYRRIQNVDVTESIFHRLLGVAVLRLETAGGSSTEATLNFVTADEARRLQREVRERRARVEAADDADAEVAVDDQPTEATVPESSALDATADSPEEVDREFREVGPEQDDGEQAAQSTDKSGAAAGHSVGEPTTIFRLGEGELLVLSLSSIRRAAFFVLAIGAPVFQDTVLGMVSRLVGADVDPGTVSQTPDLLFVAGLLTLVLGAVVSWVLSAAFTFTEYYDFTLGRQGTDLVYDRGLLQRYSGSIPTDKVQTLTIKENVLMRALGYAGLTVETAGYAPGQSGGQGGPQSAVPLAARERTLSLARDIEPFGDLSFTRPPKIARRRYAVRYLFVVVVLTLGLAAVARFLGNFRLWPAPLALLAVVPVAAHLKWKHRGYHVGEDYFAARTGFWRQRTRVVPYYRLQTVIRSRTIFQRRLNIAHFTADTATSSSLGGGDPTAFDIDDEDAKRLVGLLRERLQESLGVEEPLSTAE